MAGVVGPEDPDGVGVSVFVGAGVVAGDVDGDVDGEWAGFGDFADLGFTVGGRTEVEVDGCVGFAAGWTFALDAGRTQT